MHEKRFAIGAIALAASLAWATVAEAQAPPLPGPPWRIVILHGSDAQLPASVLADTAFREAVTAGGSTRVEMFREDLDTIRFPAAALDAELVSLLTKKHTSRPPHVVVAFTGNALAFAERHHEKLWPSATLVFMGVNERELERTRGRHAATGVVVRRENAKNVELALKLLPETRRIVLIAGVSDFDRETMALAKTDMARFQGRVEIEYLENLPFDDIQARVASYREGTLLFPVSFYRDARGQSFIPAEAFFKLTETAQVPNVAVVSSRIGRRMLGGHLINYSDQGREAGKLVLDILAGREARKIPVRSPESGCVVDWRELRRWKIPESRVPRDCEVRFREHSFLGQHWPVMLAVASVILLQAALIALLIVQSRRRRAAEIASQRQHAQLAHAARLATVGELTASIAHEINQPLGAILSNADAAEILLESPQPDLAEVRQILADIRRDDERASAVIQRLRTLLARHDLERQRLEPNAVAREAIALISQEADRRGVRLVASLASSMPAVDGDRVHLVQVMIILLMNAMDAMEFTPTERRQVVVSTAGIDDRAEFAVSDAGTGLPEADFSRLFDSFFTTKDTGMGLGLSIARSIIEAHGGMIWAENKVGGGAAFRFRLAVAK